MQPGVAGHQREKSVPATAKTTYSCSGDYSLVTIPMRGQECRKSVPATAKTKRSCSGDYSLKTFFVQPGVVGYRCEKSVLATAKTTYSCSEDYSLVTIPMGGQYCRKSTAATATYSCPTGYTRSGATCHKYTYTSPSGRSCPAGYSPIYTGLVVTCRKKLTTAATVTYSCSSGTLSGSNCILTATPTSMTTYSCSSGTLSGSNCVVTATPTSTTTYSCTSGTLSVSSCIFTATPTPETMYSCTSGRLSGSNCILTNTPTVTYDCDDAPDGYRLSDQNCTRVTIKIATRPTIYTCPATYTRNEPTDPTNPPTCTKIDIINATVTTTPASCPKVEPPFRLYEDRVAGRTKHTCERTITTAALITRTYSCPTDYRLEKTINGQETEYICRLKQTTTPNT